MKYLAEINLTLEELEQLKQAAGLKEETLGSLLDRCFRDAIDAEIKSLCQQPKTNFDICCESVEVMAQAIDIVKCGWSKEQVISWLKRT